MEDGYYIIVTYPGQMASYWTISYYVTKYSILLWEKLKTANHQWHPKWPEVTEDSTTLRTKQVGLETLLFCYHAETENKFSWSKNKNQREK